MNPQFFINLSDPDIYDDITHCPVVISVAQKSKERKSEHAIGFKVFKCDLSDKHLDVRFFNTHVSVCVNSLIDTIPFPILNLEINTIH